MKPLRHMSIRVRLTLVYAAVLVVICTALLALNYAMLYRSLYTNLQAPSPDEFATWAASVPHDTQTEEKIQAFQEQQTEIARRRTDTLIDTAATSAAALAITAVLGLGVSWVVAGRTLRPLRSLTAASRRISQDRLHERIELTGPDDELKELADTFDEMVARLEASFSSQRRFVADAAHELRTPLAIVRTGIEVQLAKRNSTPEQWEAMARRVLTAAGRAERTLDGLLALARSDSGVMDHGSCDLAVAAAGAISDADPEVERAGLVITTDLRPAPALGDPALLDRLVANLVNNAVRHNHHGGWVAVETGKGGQGAVVKVSNSGEQIPPAEIGRLFEPFRRLSSDRPTGSRSTGLGLAIVRSITNAHGGTVVATPNPGGGLSVIITLPAARQDQILA